MEGHRVFVTAECPRRAHGTGTVLMRYMYCDDGKPIGMAFCRQYKDGNEICQKCICYLHTYIMYNGVPESGQLIKPDLSKYQ
jgi:hypothetical protein